MQGFLKIALPDEEQDTIVWRTLPVRPSMTTRDVCKYLFIVVSTAVMYRSVVSDKYENLFKVKDYKNSVND